MTRFNGDAIGVRSSGPRGLTKKELAKNLEIYHRTGVHPEVQKAREKAAANAVPALPLHDPNRDHVFLELASGPGGPVLGRLIIELFTDMVPVGANHLRNRCLPGSKCGLQGTTIQKLQARFAAWLGKNAAAGEGMHLSSHPQLRHVDEGAVSVSLTGDEVAIALGRALVLDKTHQVVGRVHKGIELLEQLSDLPTNHLDVPYIKVTVVKCGVTNAAGTHDELGPGQDDGLSKDPVARLAQASEGARQSVMQALAVGLGEKRKEPEGDTSVKGGGAAARNVKSKMLDDMLGGLGSDDDSEDSSGSKEGAA